MSDLHMFAIVTGVSEYHVAGLVGAATSPSEDLPGITSSSASLAPVSSLQYSQTLISPYLSLSFPLLLFISLCFKNICGSLYIVLALWFLLSGFLLFSPSMWSLVWI